jgi:short-subunit dehydrogenase
MKVNDKTWVVTGAGSGMGRQLALQLLGRGARVAAVDRDAAGLEATAAAAAAGERPSLHVVDITDQADVEALPAAVVSAHGTVDGLVNNAGIIQAVPAGRRPGRRDKPAGLDVNLMGTLHMVRAFLPALRSRPEAHIVNVSSMGGFFPFPGQTIYGASKAAVKLLTEGLYAELLDTHVHVTVIFPGAVDTAITANSGVAQPAGGQESGVRITSAEKAARIMIKGIEDRLHIYVGPDAKAMSVAIKLAPRTAIRFVQQQMSKRLDTRQPTAPL